jgi:hypothetical protein
MKIFEVSIIFREGIDSENYKVKGSRFLFPIRAFLVLRRIKLEVIHSQGTWNSLLPGVILDALTRYEKVKKT